MQRFMPGWIVLVLLFSACTLAVEPVPEMLTPPPAAAPTDAPATEPAPLLSTPGAVCPDPDALNLATVIASGYTFTSPEEVTGWFCNGAEFEDIVIALETEDQTGVPAEDLLAMLASGMTWEDIWQSIGLTD
ncbi:MAG: hypothetical protein WHV44_06465 [Anaerolineales bacterium]